MPHHIDRRRAECNYVDLKNIIINNSLSWQFIDTPAKYDIFTLSNNIEYCTKVWKSGFEPSGIDVGQNTSDRSDFETNYEPTANQAMPTKLTPFNVLVFGQKTVTTAGTRVILLTSTATDSLIITAKSNNTGNIFVGDVTVTSANGYILEPGSSVSLDINHASVNIYIDSAVNGEGVSFISGRAT